MPQIATVTAWHLPVRRFVHTLVVRWFECAKWIAFIWCTVVSFLGQGCLWNYGIWTCN